MTIIETGIHDPKPDDLCKKIPHHNNEAFFSGLCYFIAKLS